MSVQFGIDASSFQGNVNWARADSTTSFGWEKVTQGSRKTASRGYVNPFWAGPAGNSKRALAARAAATGFVPGGYLFLEAGDGTGQADFFHAAAGDMAGFAIAVDVEPAAVVHRVDAGDNEVSYVVTGLSAPRRPHPLGRR
jgi:hypothetical protein